MVSIRLDAKGCLELHGGTFYSGDFLGGFYSLRREGLPGTGRPKAPKGELQVSIRLDAKGCLEPSPLEGGSDKPCCGQFTHLTPEASPEEPIGVAADVYALVSATHT